MKYTDKDLKYIILILIVVIIFILGIIFNNDKELSGMLNFAATITSIILAVLAIILTLTESVKNESSNRNIIESTERLKMSVDELKRVSSTLSNECILDALNDLGAKVEITRQQMQENFFTQMNSTRKVDTDNLTQAVKTKVVLAELLDSLNSNDNLTIRAVYLVSKLCDKYGEFDVADDRFVGALYDFVNDKFVEDDEPAKDFNLGKIASQIVFLERLSVLTPNNQILNEVLNDYGSHMFIGVDKFIKND